MLKAQSIYQTLMKQAARPRKPRQTQTIVPQGRDPRGRYLPRQPRIEAVPQDQVSSPATPQTQSAPVSQVPASAGATGTQQAVNFESLSRPQQINALESLYHQTWNYFNNNVIPRIKQEMQQANKLINLFSEVRPVWKSLRAGIRQNPQLAESLNPQDILNAHSTLTRAAQALERLQSSADDPMILSEFQQQLTTAFNAIQALTHGGKVDTGQPQVTRPSTQIPPRPETILPPRPETVLRPNIANSKGIILTAASSSAMRLFSRE